MGNASTEKKKQRLRRKKARQRIESQKETLCIACGNQEWTVDETGRCESCRRDVYETDCAMCDFD